MLHLCNTVWHQPMMLAHHSFCRQIRHQARKCSAQQRE